MGAPSITRPEPFFIGDHLAIDFLNSLAAPRGELIDWLDSGANLVDWLEKAGAIDAVVGEQFRTGGDTFHTLDAVAEQARGLREWLRGFVDRHAGTALAPDVMDELEPLNRLLARDDTYREVRAVNLRASNEIDGIAHPLRWVRVRRWTTPERMLQPVAEAIGDLVCHEDFTLVRTCEGPGCTLVFYDRTKAHARRWCSMAVCGNRAKAAAHRAKNRQAKLAGA